MKSELWIRVLLRLYPARFRERFGESMIAFHRERTRDGIRPWGWVRIVLDHLAVAVAEHARGWVNGARHALPAAELGYALRALVRHPGFSLVVILTIGLGVGANTAIFSVVRGVLLRPLPYPDADQVVSVGHEEPMWLASPPEYLDYQLGVRSFAALAAYTKSEGNLSSDGEPQRVALASVTPSFFDVLGVSPQIGRVLAADEDAPPAPVVVISHRLWQTGFAGDSVLGRSITLGGRPRMVVGVMPPDFDYPTAQTDLWLPLPRVPQDGDRTNHYLFLVARIRPGVPLAAARSESNAIARRMTEEHSENYDPRYPPVPVLTPVGDALLGGARPFLWASFATVGFVLLIVCANVGNLLLVRGEARRKEIALRGALGADRGQLLGQLLTEAVVLAGVGGLLGWGVAVLAEHALLTVAPAIPRMDEVHLDGSALLFTLALTLATGLAFGVLPAARLSGAAPASLLELRGRGSGQRSAVRTRRALVVAQVAVAMVLLSGAGLFLRSLRELQSASMGFEPEGVLTAKVSLTPAAYDDVRAAAFYAELVERIGLLPGVEAVGAAGWLAVAEAGGLWGILAEGQSYDSVPQTPTAAPQQVTPGYFTAMGIPLLRGRDVSVEDGPFGPYVAVVSQSMAEMLWPGLDPLGKRFRVGGGSTYATVVGVVGDIRSRGFDDTPEPTMYFPHAQTATTANFMPRSLTLVVRAAGDPTLLVPEVRAIARTLDPTAPLSSVRTLNEVVLTAVASRRFSTTLIAVFAAVALLLAAFGVFNVVSHAVSERTYEIGVRVALGAERGTILSLVVAESARMAAAGIVLGLIGAAGVGRAVRSLLVGVPAFDPLTLGAVSAGIALVVILAAMVPARRATRIAPMDSLRAG